MTLPFQITVYDANGLVKSTSSGGLNSPVDIADGGTGETTAAAAFAALAPAGTEGDVMTFTGGAWSAETPAVASGDYILIREEQNDGTNGGGITGSTSPVTWTTRTLNKIVLNPGSRASLSNNQITLAAGTYDIDALVPAYACNNHQSGLYNVSDSDWVTLTDGTSKAYGTSEYNSNAAQTPSRIWGRFTLASSKVLEIRTSASGTRATTGLGYAGSRGIKEIYTVVKLGIVA